MSQLDVRPDSDISALPDLGDPPKAVSAAE